MVHGSPNIHAPTSKKKKKKRKPYRVHHLSKQNSFKSPTISYYSNKTKFKKEKKNKNSRASDDNHDDMGKLPWYALAVDSSEAWDGHNGGRASSLEVAVDVRYKRKVIAFAFLHDKHRHKLSDFQH